MLGRVSPNRVVNLRATPRRASAQGRLRVASTPLARSTSRKVGAVRTFATSRSTFLMRPSVEFDLKKATVKPEQVTPIPMYRVVDLDGTIVNPKDIPSELGEKELTDIYRQMLTLHEMDKILYEVQRHNRISFYMTAFGEEATHFGSAAALDKDDIVYAQYREAGVFMYRGFQVADFVHQCFSTQKDRGKGRQMPVHYGAADLNIQTISSPLATQIPQASGAAYALKMQGKKNVVICYFGEGAASEGDFHAALNIAVTRDCPAIFFCRNNEYAISTPSSEQYGGDHIAGRGVSYGMKTIRVDGNDFFAVYNATKEARKYAVENAKPVLIEAMTYRVGHHSTSDDSTRYRGQEEIDQWVTGNNPLTRMKEYLEAKGWWNQDLEVAARKDGRDAVLAAMKEAEVEPKPAASNLFRDVYQDLPQHLLEQEQELKEHLQKYPDHYPKHYAPEK